LRLKCPIYFEYFEKYLDLFLITLPRTLFACPPERKQCARPKKKEEREREREREKQ
jgi:hypothetical protein